MEPKRIIKYIAALLVSLLLIHIACIMLLDNGLHGGVAESMYTILYWLAFIVPFTILALTGLLVFTALKKRFCMRID